MELKVYTEPMAELLYCSGQENTDGNDWLIEYAGRVCTDTVGNPATRNMFILNRIRQGHESIIEHCTASFQIICSRACQNQIVRHRHGSFSVQSQRYVDYTKKYPFIVLCSQAEKDFTPIIDSAKRNFTDYTELIKQGFLPEDARNVLPNCTGTVMVITANFREWLHILRLRLDNHAQYEFQQVCKSILLQLRDFSIIFKEYEKIKELKA